MKTTRFAILAAMILAVIAPVTGHSSVDTNIVEARFASRLASFPFASVDALVSVEGKATAADASAMRALGLSVPRVFEDFGVLYVVGRSSTILGLSRLARVQRVTANEEITWAGDTDTVATRAREAWDTKSTSTTPVIVGGQVVDGKGVGVAIVDGGVDGDNPDLAPGMVYSAKFAGLLVSLNGCSDLLWVQSSDSDSTSGHGTHVAGIVAGRGTTSAGKYTGTAPGASLYGLGVGDANRILNALEAFNWIHCHKTGVNGGPAIRVVNNSWGSAGSYNANDATNKAANTLVADGMTVLFAAGNSGGSGSTDVTESQSKNPTPGVISVANYDEQHKATRTGILAVSSSRGNANAANRDIWPDISAPGSRIVSTASKTGTTVPPSPLNYHGTYALASGTSMATPHVAGIVALLLQAKPSLTPAQVEDILEDTALAFTTPGGYLSDPSNPTTGTNYGAGHGLADAIAALADPRVGATGGSALPQVSPSFQVFTAGFDLQYTAGNGYTVPANVEVGLAELGMATGDPGAYPLSDGQPGAFRVTGPSGTTIATGTVVQGDPGFELRIPFTFPSPGTYTVEGQIDFGSGLRAFDSARVTVI